MTDTKKLSSQDVFKALASGFNADPFFRAALEAIAGGLLAGQKPLAALEAGKNAIVATAREILAGVTPTPVPAAVTRPVTAKELYETPIRGARKRAKTGRRPGRPRLTEEEKAARKAAKLAARGVKVGRKARKQRAGRTKKARLVAQKASKAPKAAGRRPGRPKVAEAQKVASKALKAASGRRGRRKGSSVGLPIIPGATAPPMVETTSPAGKQVLVSEAEVLDLKLNG